MNRAVDIFLGLTATLLTACNGAAPATPTARVEVFTASDQRVPRNKPVTLLWLVADAGIQDGILSCELTRRVGDEPTATPLNASCTGNLTEIPPAPLTATTVHYHLRVLKRPHDTSDLYLTETRSVTLDAALYATSAGGAGFDEARGLTTLADGGAIVTGYFQGTATFGPTTLMSAGADDAFVARIGADGAW